MTDDERFAQWAERIKRISQEISSAAWNRKLFRAVQAMFKTNEKLSRTEGSREIWNWIAGMSGSYFAMTVRREIDGQRNTQSLIQLLQDMSKFSHVLTRGRYAEGFETAGLPASLAHSQFLRFGELVELASGDAHLSSASIRKDIGELRSKTATVKDYASQVVAHRAPVGKKSLKIADVDNALTAIFECMNRYHVLLTGASMAGATPVPQYDHLAPFRIAWMPKGFKEPTDELAP